MRISRETWGGIGVSILALFMIWQSSQYTFGSLLRAGPGFFPMVFSVVLLGLGLVMALESALTPREKQEAEAEQDEPFALRSLLAVSAGILTFYLLITRFGLVPATFGLVMVSAFAERPVHLIRALLTAVLLSVIVVVLFIYLFRLPLTALRWP